MLRPRMHASRNFGSVGHGAFRFTHIINPFSANITPAKVKIKTLCSDIQIRPGTFEASPANTAPKPRLTNNAGSAQQTNVLIEVNNVR